jgi:hypothetical protein
MNMNMNMDTLELVVFGLDQPVIYLRSWGNMHSMMAIKIQEEFNMIVPLSEIATNSLAIVQQYINAMPNLHNLTFHSNFQGGLIQTISGLRGAQTFTWIKIFSSQPHLPLIETSAMLTNLASEGPSMIPPSPVNYLVYFHGLKVSFFIKCNLPVVPGTTAIKPISVMLSSNYPFQFMTTLAPDLLNLTNPYHAMRIDLTLRAITMVDPSALSTEFMVITP